MKKLIALVFVVGFFVGFKVGEVSGLSGAMYTVAQEYEKKGGG